MIRKTGQSVGHRELLQLLVLDSQCVVRVGQLLASFAQTLHHVVEHFGEKPDLSTTSVREIHAEIAGGYLRGSLREALERANDEKTQPIRRQCHDDQKQRDRDQRGVAESSDLLERSVL